MTTVSFPNMGLSFEINRTAFTLGGFEVYWYGVLIGLGMLLAMVYAFPKLKKLGVDEDKFIDVLIVCIIAGVVGARLYYVVFSNPSQYRTFWDLIDLRDGGLAFYGAVIFAFAAAYIMCRVKKLKILPVLDIASIGFLIGQGIGRWGNFFNQEAFGTNTNLPWGMTSKTVESYLASHLSEIEAHGMTVNPALPVHPTFLYESLWLIAGFIVLACYLKHRKFDGEIALMFFAWNGAGRAVIEGLRTDSLYIGNIRVSQMLAIIGVVLSVAAIVLIRIRQKKSGDENYLKPYGMTEEWAKEYAAIVERQENEKKKSKKTEEPKENEEASTKTEE
ncbi:MAG: prolipoprotein diacylglyceryl transferase [Ruminococcaceae bacterium]|nr:prolipoprotein diacylglyceryl transferase [Oscillospiraceae bacterium]